MNRDDQFEKRLQRQPLRNIPREWRAEILSAAQETPASRYSSPVTRHAFLPNLISQLSALLWPHPRAWAGLMAVWILIFTLNVLTGDQSQASAKKSAPPSPEVIAELCEQRLLFTELVGPIELRHAGPPKSLPPRPRSERRHEILRA